MKSFLSSLPFHGADPSIYEALKHLRILRPQNEPLPDAHVYESFAPSLGIETERWIGYEAPRLLAAAQGLRGRHFLAPFPGHTLPGPGADESVLARGSLMVDWEAHTRALSWPVCPKEHHWSTELLDSKVERVCLINASDIGLATARWPQEDEQVLKRAIEQNDGARLNQWVRRCWNPHDQTSLDLPPTTHTYLQRLCTIFRSEMADPYAFALEAVDIVTRLHISCTLGIRPIGAGVYEHAWLDVGLMPLLHIRATELVVTARVVTEIETLKERGFAPIVVNEFGCNTDGSHRQTAYSFWNASCLPHGQRDTLTMRVERFAQMHEHALGHLLTRELRRVAQEIEANPDLKERCLAIVSEAQPEKRIDHVPVLLVPEYSAATVVKGPYDQDEGLIGVCPELYRRLSKNDHLTLPARGPYHRTDRALLPWFIMVRS